MATKAQPAQTTPATTDADKNLKKKHPARRDYTKVHRYIRDLSAAMFPDKPPSFCLQTMTHLQNVVDYLIESVVERTMGLANSRLKKQWKPAKTTTPAKTATPAGTPVPKARAPRRTIRAQEVFTAIELIVPYVIHPELNTALMRAMNLAKTRYEASMSETNGAAAATDADGKKPEGQTRSKRAGLKMPVSRIETAMKEQAQNFNIGVMPPILLSAFIEAVLGRIFTNARSLPRAGRIDDHTILLAIQCDSPLNSIFRHAKLMSTHGGMKPTLNIAAPPPPRDGKKVKRYRAAPKPEAATPPAPAPAARKRKPAGDAKEVAATKSAPKKTAAAAPAKTAAVPKAAAPKPGAAKAAPAAKTVATGAAKKAPVAATKAAAPQKKEPAAGAKAAAPAAAAKKAAPAATATKKAAPAKKAVAA